MHWYEIIDLTRPEEKLETFPSRLSFPASEFCINYYIGLEWRQHCRSGGDCRQTFPFKSETRRAWRAGQTGRTSSKVFSSTVGTADRAELSCSVLSFSSIQADHSTVSAPTGQCILGWIIKICQLRPCQETVLSETIKSLKIILKITLVCTYL